tara:strand:- start:683 stop:1543 length:861 start_codon:yes stop_codon:yes gene_type:complete
VIYLPNIIISLIKKLRLYNFLKKIYKKFLERFISFEIKTIENYIINNLVEKNFGAIIDIGAHKGDKTSLFLKFFPKDNYYLFEPFDKYYQIIKKKFRNSNNIKVYRKAVSNYEGSGKFYTSNKNIYAESFSLEKYEFLENFEKIEIVNLDNIEFKEKVKLIKLDAEGKEPEIIEGASKLILSNKPILLIETSNLTHELIEKNLLNLNYILFIYEYFNIKNSSVDIRNLGDLTKLSKNDVTSSNRFDQKFYKIKKIAKNSQFLTNSVAIPNHKDFLTSIRIEEISLN